MAVKIPSMLGSMSPTFQKAWYKKHKMPLPAHLQRPSQSDKVDTTRTKSLQAKSLRAYGATKGAKVGGEYGSGEMKDTIAPLTRDQHSKVQAAARAAKAAEKAAAPKRAPIKSKEDRLNFLKKAFSKSKSEKRQARFDVPTLEKDDDSHDDLRDVHQSLHIRKGYNEEVEQISENSMKDKIDPKDLPFTPDKKKVRRGTGGPMSQAKWLAKQAMMKKMKEMGMKEEVVSEAPRLPVDAGEYDYEGDMAKSQLRSILANAKRMHDMLDDKANLPEWVQSKITLAEDYIATAANYMEGEMNEAVEQVEEGKVAKALAVGALSLASMGAKAHSDTTKSVAQLSHERPAVSALLHKIGATGQVPASDKRAAELQRKQDQEMPASERHAKQLKNEEVEQVNEKAPPGAKYERMVKHIKKGYAKGGLTDKERSIAYATAWKAHNKANEEVEQIDELKKSTLASYVNKAAHQVRAKSGIAASFETQGTRKRNPENKSAYMDVAKDFRQGAKKRLTGIEKATAKLSKEEVEQVEEKYENNPLHSMPRPNKAVGLKPSQLAKKPAMAAEAAEGSTPTSPKEKALAAHHGDPNKITFGDVVKARIKSAAQKAMNKGK